MSGEGPATGSLFSARRGDGAAALVLLHGFGGSHAAWNEITAKLSGDAKTIAYDLPGHGLSLDVPGAGQAKATARAILADLAQNDLGQIHVAGHSMGGAVAVLMALSAPEKIASLTLLAPGGFGQAINGALLRRYAAAATGADLVACLTAMSGPGAAASPSDLQSRLAMRARPGQIETLTAIVDTIARDDRQGVIPPERLASLAMPVSILWGTGDPVLPFAQSNGLPPRFDRRALPGAGHMLIEEAPDAVLEAIRLRLTGSPR